MRTWPLIPLLMTSLGGAALCGCASLGGTGATTWSGIGGATTLAAEKQQKLITGVALTTAGATGALLGGVFLGRSGGLCSGDEACGASVAFPVMGTLWVGASVLPLILGVSMLVPKAPDASAPAAPAATAPSMTLLVGPRAAGVQVSF